MTPEQNQLVRDSFAQIKPIAPQAAAMFYARLFELDPSLRALFKGDMAAQGQKLVAMIATAVAGLDAPAALIPALRALGERHRSYGVRADDYETVATALLWTLEKGLGAGFTPAVKHAWLACFTLIAGEMKSAAALHTPAITPSAVPSRPS
jgi:hemoglobin-like flavoprotein